MKSDQWAIYREIDPNEEDGEDMPGKIAIAVFWFEDKDAIESYEALHKMFPWPGLKIVVIIEGVG